ANDVGQSTPFSFTPERAGCNVFSIQHVQYWTVSLYTLESQVTFPDLQTSGVAWAGEQMSWQASTISPCDSIDDFVMPPAPAAALKPTMSVYTQSASRSFI